MSLVVSDTSPLHYLILCGAENVLPRLFRRVFVPPTVFRELQHPNTPTLARQWATALPPWVVLQAPKVVDLALDIDAGEQEAISSARELNADALLIDDRAGRTAALRYGLPVIGTVAVLEQAATRGFLDLPEVLERLRQTNARLDPELIRACLQRDALRKRTHG